MTDMEGVFHTRSSDSRRSSMNNTIMTMEDVISSSGTGARSVADGTSVHTRLASLKSDAALRLLAQTTWRTYFTASPSLSAASTFISPNGSPTRPMSSTAPMRAVSSPIRPLSATVPVRPLSPVKHISPVLSTSDQIRFASSNGYDSVSVAFYEMVGRVDGLWEDLRIPHADRKFYRESLCKGPPSSLQQCQELSKYILMLKAHRTATLAVLRAIEIREFALSKCMDFLYAINRKSSRLTANLFLAARGGRESIRDLATASFSDDARSAVVTSPHVVTAALFREELIGTLRDIQLATLDVVRLIQLWRRNLWRPYPFMYKKEGFQECNYMIKMSHDLDVLRLDFYMDILLGIPLNATDLLCVLFNNADTEKSEIHNTDRKEEGLSNHNDRHLVGIDGKIDSKSADKSVSFAVDQGGDINQEINDRSPHLSEGESNSNLQTAPAPSKHSQGPSFATPHTTQGPSFASTPHTAHTTENKNNKMGPIFTSSQDLDSIESDVENYFRASFFLDRDSQDLRNASAVVEEEEKLEKALAMERIKLKDQKVFIPLLKLKPFVLKGSNGDRE